MPFDPLAPLPDAPDPWASFPMPALRDRPPYLMTEMIAAEPALAERVAVRLGALPAAAELARRISVAAKAREPMLATGCGTSEHAAMAVGAFLSDALGLGPPGVAAVEAFELAGRPPDGGVVIGVSHEGGTRATTDALAAARASGATTALVTVSDRSPAANSADLVLPTGEQDQSWCHTVGYLSPLVAGTVLGALLRGEAPDGVALRALLDVADQQPVVETMASALTACDRLLVVGSAIDYVGARELAMKVEEGTGMPASAHHLETLRHGHLAAATELTGLVLLLADGERRGEPLLDRARAVLRSARILEMPAAALIAADLVDAVPAELTPAGRAAIPLVQRLPRVVGAAIGVAIPLQLLTERIARARGRNPDAIGRDDPRQAAAAEA